MSDGLEAAFIKCDGSHPEDQIVDGQWWHPKWGCDSLQHLLDAHDTSLAAEQEKYRQLRVGEQLRIEEAKKLRDAVKTHAEAYANVLHNLGEARKLLFAVQPFCEAWQCQSLSDEIKDFLDGRTKEMTVRPELPTKYKIGRESDEPPPLHTKD